MGHFINKKPMKMLNYFIDQNRIESLMTHLSSSSVCELLGKILAIETSKHLEIRK